MTEATTPAPGAMKITIQKALGGAVYVKDADGATLCGFHGGTEGEVLLSILLQAMGKIAAYEITDMRVTDPHNLLPGN